MKHAVTVVYPDLYFFPYTITSKETDPAKLLERIFKEWNHGSGKECKLFIDNRVNSLSVNDIVILNDKNYLCLEAGWEVISTAEVLSIEKAVATHPERHSKGTSYVLQKVMDERYQKYVDEISITE